MQGKTQRAAGDWRWTLWVFGAIFVLAALHIGLFKLAPIGADDWPKSAGWDQWDSERLSTALAIAGAVGLGGYALLRRRVDLDTPRRQRWLKVVIGLMVVVAGANYFSARRSGKMSYLHTWDTFHYAMGAKYYEELDYFYLYDCAAEALGPEQIRDNAKIRNLRTYKKYKAGEARATYGEECRARFTEERWQQFSDDIQVFADATSVRFVRDILGDHGYNGTPFQSFVSGVIINAVPMSYQSLSWMILLDVFAMCLALVGVCWAFGWRMGMVFALHAFILAVDRFAITGCSFVRYWWLASLILGVCALQRKRYAAGGALLTVASAFVVFPVIFVAGAGLSLLGGAWRRRTLTPALKRFLMGTAVAGVLCGAAGASYGNGISNYSLFAKDMEVHTQGPKNKAVGRLVQTPGYGVGLKYIFYYRGQHANKYKGPSNVEFARQIHQIRPVIVGLGIALTAFAGALALRLNPVEAASLFGIVGFFSLLGTTGYYFACADLIVLLFYRRRFSADGPLLIAVFFLLSATAIYVLGATRVESLMYRTVVSMTWTLFFCVVMARLATLTGLWNRMGAPFRGDPAKAARAWPVGGLESEEPPASSGPISRRPV